MFGSGLKAIYESSTDNFIWDADVLIMIGRKEIACANARYLLLKAKDGYKNCHKELTDYMVTYGSWDVYKLIWKSAMPNLVLKSFSFKSEWMDSIFYKSIQVKLETVV